MALKSNGKVVKSIEELVNKLSQERFRGREINWQLSSWGGTPVELAQDNKDYFLKIRDHIYIQAKIGKSEERLLRCYNCGKEALVKKSSIQYNARGRQVRTAFIPYCPNCDTEPQDFYY